MEPYIPKSVVLAEIERIYNEGYKFSPSDIAENIQNFKDDVLININTLEVKEVDLDEVIMKYQREIYDRDTTVRDVAKHFFELGLKAQKGEEAEKST